MSLLSCLIAGAATGSTGENATSIPLSSVVRIGDQILAANKFGLYRAVADKRQWERVETPSSMPFKGRFAAGPVDSKRVFYYTPSFTSHPKSDGPLRFDIYVSDDLGQHWRLASDTEDFRDVHACGKSIYAITEIEEHENGQPYTRNRILKSNDDCVTWDDITADIGPGILLDHILDDPDNKDDICLDGSGTREEMFQHTLHSENWTMIEGNDWSQKRATDATFLAPEYSTTWRAETLRATLANYFQHQFGALVELPAFELVTEKTNYEFAADKPKRINVEIKMRDKSASDKLVDLAEGSECWFWRVVRPDGGRVYLTFDFSNNWDPRRKELRTRKDFRSFAIGGKQRYRRSVDLESYGGFSTPGRYQVEVLFCDEGVAQREKKEWMGTFSAKPITVTIR
jgi:hypothetical protein